MLSEDKSLYGKQQVLDFKSSPIVQSIKDFVSKKFKKDKVQLVYVNENGDIWELGLRFTIDVDSPQFQQQRENAKSKAYEIKRALEEELMKNYNIPNMSIQGVKLVGENLVEFGISFIYANKGNIKVNYEAKQKRVDRLIERVLAEAVLKEDWVSMEQINDVLSNLPPQEKIALNMKTKVMMNKTIVDTVTGEKKSNPFYDKVWKLQTVYGRVNYSYSDEYKKNTGEEPSSDPKRSLGDKKGAIVVKDGKARLPLTDVETATPVYEINGNEVSKEELKPYLKAIVPQQSSSVKMIAPYLDNVKSIAIGNKEYKIVS